MYLEAGSIITRLKGCFETAKNVLFAILYGSVARGGSTSESDIDVAIYTTDEVGVDERIELIYRIAKCIGVSEDKVDVVVLGDSTPLELRYKIFRDGILIFSRDIEFYRRYRDESISMYLDLKVALRAARYGEIYINKIKADLFGTEG